MAKLLLFGLLIFASCAQDDPQPQTILSKRDIGNGLCEYTYTIDSRGGIIEDAIILKFTGKCSFNVGDKVTLN